MPITDCELSCDYKDTGSEELFRSLIQLDDDGCRALRQEATTASDTSCDQFDCNDITIGLEEIFRKLLFIDSNGCLSMRIATTTIT